MEPAITVVMATFNRAPAAVRAARCVLAQDYRGFRLLVIGDCCTDDTGAQLAALGDPRIEFINIILVDDDGAGRRSSGGLWMTLSEFEASVRTPTLCTNELRTLASLLLSASADVECQKL